MNTICANSTATGGAIGIIRISGNEATDITSRIFVSPKCIDLNTVKGYTVHYGKIVNGEETIDEVVVIVYRSPHSYTGEDTVEIMCHGSAYIIQTILDMLVNAGCRMAKPGEFTQRAFLAGKMDLSQAEAVADLIAASNAATHRLAMSQMRGDFSQELRSLRDKLLQMTSLLELEIDFSEEDVEFADRTQLLNIAQTISNVISRLLDSFRLGNAIKNGVPVAIIGATNVGKSTLLNRMLHEDRAIVSDVHGTTRDSIEDCINIQGITFRFIDTAGIRNTSDSIEQIGIQRSWQKAKEAEIVLLVTDQTTEIDTSELAGKHIITVYNKTDINPVTNPLPPQSIAISAKSGEGIDRLEQMLVDASNINKISDSDIIVTNLRHAEALRNALSAIQKVEHQLQDGVTTSDIIALDLHACIHALADIVGDVSSSDTLHNIFKHFCVGK